MSGPAKGLYLGSFAPVLWCRCPGLGTPKNTIVASVPVGLCRFCAGIHGCKLLLWRPHVV